MRDAELVLSGHKPLLVPNAKPDSQTLPKRLGIPPKNLNLSKGIEMGWWSRGESNP
jgi:hypothetical protein